MPLHPPSKLRRLLCGAALLPLLFAPLAHAANPAPGSAGELNIYNWSDYIAEDTIANFEKETGIKVRYDNFDTNETLHAKLVAGNTGYDIVVPSSHWGKLQIEGGLLLPLDKNKITTYSNLDPALMKQIAALDPGNKYLVPWLWGFTTVGINVDRVKKALGDMPMPENAWDLVFKPEYASKLKSCGISMLDSGDEIFPAALRYLGKPAFSANADDYAQAAKMLKAIRPNVKLFSSSGYINNLADGSLCLSLGWSGDIGIAAARAKAAKKPQNIEILVPSTGAVLFFDTMAIPKDAKNVDNAYKFMSYIYRPEVQAAIVNTVNYANPVRAADKMIKPEVANNKGVFPSADQLAKMVPPEVVNNETRRLRTRLFQSFKTNR